MIDGPKEMLSNLQSFGFIDEACETIGKELSVIAVHTDGMTTTPETVAEVVAVERIFELTQGPKLPESCALPAE